MNRKTGMRYRTILLCLCSLFLMPMQCMADQETEEAEKILQEEESICAEGADPVKFTAKSGSYTLLSVNTATGATQTHTIKVSVDKTVDMSAGSQNAAFTATSSGNWKTISVSGEKKVMGIVTEAGVKSPYRYIFYQALQVPKPAGYIVSSAVVSDYLGANKDTYKVGADIRWDYSNTGNQYSNVANNGYFDAKLLNQCAPVVGASDMRYHNTYAEESVLKLMLVTSCRNTGLRLSAQPEAVKNMTVTVSYVPAAYSVNYNSSGGSACASSRVLYDANLYLPTPTRKGYTFAGWSGAGLNGAKGTVKNLTTENNKVIELTALWQANTYTVEFDSAGGMAISSATAVYDQGFTLPDCKRTGYLFTGWTGAGLTSRVGTVSNLTDANGGRVKLTAGWKPITYRVVLRENGGSKCEPMTLVYGQEAELPTPTREGYVFLGWSGAGLVKKTGKIKNLSTADNTVVELTAEWEAEPDPDDKLEEIEKKIDDIIEKQEGEKPASYVDNTYYNTYGLTGEQAKEWLRALVSGAEVKLRIDGVEYTLKKNEDGSITLKLSDMGNAETIVIPNEITIGDTTYPITAIDAYCFRDNQKLKEAVMGNHILRIETSAFENCRNLEKIRLNEGLVSIGDKAFYHCEKLSELLLPEGLQTIGVSAFEGCNALRELKLNEGLLSVGKRAFFSCSGLKTLQICKSVLKIGDEAFASCKKLETVTCVSGCELLKLGKKVFKGDEALKKAGLPDKLSAVSQETFAGCKSLAKVTGMKAVTRIETRSFFGCKALAKITLPSNLQKVGKQAFYGCKKLSRVTIRSKLLSKVGKNAFVKCSKKLRFQVPKSKGETYRKLMRGKY